LQLDLYQPIYTASGLKSSTFENKGIILNLEGFNGPVAISKSNFYKNLITIRGISHAPYLQSFQKYTKSTVRASSSYRSGRLFCLGSLMPLLAEPIATEHVNLIYIHQAAEVTISECDF
jgi:hypothetical protein